MNTKAMFEALLKIIDTIECKRYVDVNDVFAIRDIAQKALMTKPRNCDIGDAKERSSRFKEFCMSDDCDCTCCPLWKGELENIRCSIIWEDMEYEGAIK